MKRVILGSVLVLFGVLIALQPFDWIEARYHVDPDAGSGALELVVSTVLVGAGALVLGAVWRSRYRRADRAGQHRSSATTSEN
jgi:hypothetical protein